MQRTFKSRGGLPWWFWRRGANRDDRLETIDILSLFAGGVQGGWWDPSDLSTLFQLSTGTTPVTADGQPVGYIADKSGNGNHLIQAVAASRPLYRTAGGLRWLESDGTDDGLQKAFTINQPWERVSALRQITWVLNDRIFGGGAAAGGILYQRPGTPSVTVFSGADGPVAAPAVGADFVLTERHDGTSSRASLNDGGTVTGSAGTTAPGGLALFKNSNSSAFGHARCYGLIMRAGRMTEQQLELVRKHFAAKAGVRI